MVDIVRTSVKLLFVRLFCVLLEENMNKKIFTQSKLSLHYIVAQRKMQCSKDLNTYFDCIILIIVGIMPLFIYKSV